MRRLCLSVRLFVMQARFDAGLSPDKPLAYLWNWPRRARLDEGHNDA